MKRIVNSFRITSRLSAGLVPFLLAAVVLPLLTLAVYGLYSIYVNGHALYFIASLALGAAITIATLFWLKKDASRTIDETLDKSLVEASADWSDFDNRVWLDLNGRIGEILTNNPDWSDLKDYGLELASLTADRYSNNSSHRELAFSALELLMMIEEISRRYRYILRTHVPFAENIKLSTLKLLYDHKDKLDTAKSFWGVYRTYRVFSPAGLFSEARGKILGKIFGGVSDELQARLKQALLQEVLAVAIDLYSGRFQASDDELEQSRSARHDRKCMVRELDPLRVCLLGQVNSGKSSLVNALTSSMTAEVSQLPSTDAVQVYQCRLDGIDTLHLVDLPGLDADTKQEQQLLDQVTNSDLVIWVLRADQPARSLDTRFKNRLDEYYSSPVNRSRKRPAIIGVLNHVDRLKPVAEWNPPYNLDNPSTEKSKAIVAALDYNRDLLAFDSLIPLSISPDNAPFNLESLIALIDEYYESGIQAQLNRRRIEYGDSVELADQARRIYQAGKSLFKIGTTTLPG